jgi:ATP-dependent helicase HrpB
MFPEGFSERRTLAYDAKLRRVVAREQRRFRDLLLDEKTSDNPSVDEAAAILAREIAGGRVVLEKWDDAVEQWIVRVNRLREWMPELALPMIAEKEREIMIEHLCHGAFGEDQLNSRPVLPVVKSWLSREQQAWVDKYAPERIALPNGRAVKVAYCGDRPPAIAARIQDLYGIKDALWVADRRIRVLIQVLAPSNRPVQITESLADFWRDTYPKLKQQLQRRYPKHEWR